MSDYIYGGLGWQPNLVVVDPRLAAPRGEEHTNVAAVRFSMLHGGKFIFYPGSLPLIPVQQDILGRLPI